MRGGSDRPTETAEWGRGRDDGERRGWGGYEHEYGYEYEYEYEHEHEHGDQYGGWGRRGE
jgi:hypothetical protein